MKIRSILVLAVAFATMASCKDDKAKEAEATETKVQPFTFTLNATVEKQDSFQVYFREDMENTPFEEENSLYIGAIASKDPQNIVFPLPENAVPTKLRLDLGTNKEQGPIMVNSFTIDYQGKSFKAEGKDFFKYFRADEKFVKLDTTSGKVIPLTTSDGNYDPMLFSTEALDNEIAKLTK